MPDETFAPLTVPGNPSLYRYFDGATWVAGTSGKTVDVVSPVDGSRLGSVQSVTREEADAAIKTVKKAQKAWELVPLHKRVRIMHLAADWIRHYEDAMTKLLVLEIGKTVADAKSEILRTADLIDYFAEEVLALRGESIESDNFPGFDKGRTAVVERAAHGIVLCIGPFNYPVNLSASKIAPALLMGNGVVFKPPTQGTLSGLYLTQLFVKAGVPQGLMCTLTGSGSDIGDALTTHPDIDMIAFTGSSSVGGKIATKAGMIPLLFECGGNNPAIVLPDADLGLAAKEIVKGGFSYSGQRCTAIKYVLAPQSVLEKLIPEVQRVLAELVHAGDPRDAATKLVGPVISDGAADGIQHAIDDAVSRGAKIVSGGKRNGRLVEPTLLSNVTPDMSVVATEVFGPVISFIGASGADEAISIINASAYGLQASVFTGDEGTGIAVARRISVGTVQINGSPQRGPDHFPFMGIKASGLGVQGVKYSLEAMSRLRSTVINNPS